MEEALEGSATVHAPGSLSESLWGPAPSPLPWAGSEEF